MTAAWERLDPRARRAVATVAAALAAVVAARLVLPRPAPAGVLLSGAIGGLSTALLAVGLVLVYRSTRVFNFAQAALGFAPAYAVFVLAGLLGWPFFAAAAAGLLLAVAVGLIVDGLFMQRLFQAPRLVPTVVTIVLTGVLARSPAYLNDIPAVGDAYANIENAGLVSSGRLRLPFPGWSVDVEPLSFGFAAAFTVGAAALVFVGLGAFFRTTRVGIALRGAAENVDRAQLLGINVRLLSTLVWVLASVLGWLAVTTSSMATTFAPVYSGEAPAITLLVPALAAAVLARMDSLPVAATAAVTIAVLQTAIFWSFPRATVVDLLLLGVIGAGLVTQRRRLVRSEAGVDSSWEATRELRPVPPELVAVAGVRRARRAVVVLAGVAVVLFPLMSSASQTNLGGLIAIQAIVALSLVVLTGWAGQVSLGQFAFVAVAAVVSGKLTGDLGWSFWLALPVAVVVTAGFAAAVALPALRIRGMFLAVTTLAFAAAVQATLFNPEYFGWLLPDRVERPSFFFVSFAGERSYYYLCVAALAVAALAVTRLRRSRAGRVLIGLRDNEPSIEAFGVSAVRTKVAAFAVAGSLAAVAGVLFVHHQRAVDAPSFGAEVSVAVFVMAMIGGISSVTGALLGAAYVGVTSFLITDPALRNLASSGALLLLLLLAPGGLASIVHSGRDAVLRIVATRQKILAPSLFEDVDPEALARRQTPLAERIPGHGLDAIPRTRRYALDSELHHQGAGA